MNEKMYNLLIRSLDEPISEEEQTKLNKALNKDEELQRRKNDLEEMRKRLGSYAPVFKAGFASRVMQRLEKERIVLDLNQNIYFLFKRVALTGAAAIILLLLGIYITMGTLNLDVILGVESLSEESLVTYLLYGN
jgi:hypothetical protein